MPAKPTKTERPIDFRIYIGMIVFRWQIIVLCFLYCLLGGVLWLQIADAQYTTSCRLMVTQEGGIHVSKPNSPWSSINAYVYLLRSPEMRRRAVDKLFDEWGQRAGGRRYMHLTVNARWARALGSTLDISALSKHPQYAEAFLRLLIEETDAEWAQMQRQATDRAVGLLQSELSRLEEKIRNAETDLIEYQRLHDIARVEARGSMEQSYLGMLVGRRSQLTTELMLLEHQYPMLKEANIGIISYADRLTRETGSLSPMDLLEMGSRDATEEGEDAGVVAGAEAGDEFAAGARRPAPTTEEGERALPRSLAVPSADESAKPATESPDDGIGWQSTRLRLVQLQQQEQELLTNLKPEHPQIKGIRSQIAKVQAQLDMLARIKLADMQDRHKALSMQLEAVEAAEYKWQAKNLYASQRRGELKRIASIVGRFESNYQSVYNRLHALRVTEELKAESFYVLQSPVSSSRPSWPDPQKILLVAVVLGLGSGLGIALLLQVVDNKIQTIRDVEEELGVPFLGGVPFWVHSGLEKAIRPIVTEERATGAIEAYRALRTSVISALQKMNEKIVLVTSADAREGKTLTALNLAIMMAEMKKKILLVDMDLRRGRLHRSLGVDREPGVTDALVQGRSLKDVIQKTRIDNLYLAPTGRSLDNTAELLQGVDLMSMFVDVQDDYEYILLDSSPVLRVTDTVIVASQGVGVVLYVARVNHTPKPLIRYSLDTLGDARILGLIMNSIEMHKVSSLYYAYQYPNYAYYSNAYAYGYSYYNYKDQSDADDHGSRSGRWDRRRQRTMQWIRRTFLPL